MVVEQNLSQTVASEPSYEDSLPETEKELSKVEAKTSFKRQSLILRSLCFSILRVVLPSLTRPSHSFQPHSSQQKELAGSSWIAESSLQQKELAKTAAKSLQHQELVKLTAKSLQQTELASFWLKAFKRGPTRASQLTLQSFQLTLAQLCFKAQCPQGPTRARQLQSFQLTNAQLCLLKQLSVDQRDACRQDPGSAKAASAKNLFRQELFSESAKAAALEISFAAGAFDTAGFAAAAPAATASASCVTSSSSPSRPKASTATPTTTTTTTTTTTHREPTFSKRWAKGRHTSSTSVCFRSYALRQGNLCRHLSGGVSEGQRACRDAHLLKKGSRACRGLSRASKTFTNSDNNNVKHTFAESRPNLRAPIRRRRTWQ